MKLVDYAEVRRLAGERDCNVKRVAAMTAEVRHKVASGNPVGTFVSVDARGEHWDAISVMRACHIAQSATDSTYRPGRTTPPAGLDVVGHGLHEDRIVEAIVADGVWAYRGDRRTLALESLLRCEGASRGLMFADTNHTVRKAAQAVVDAGLAAIAFGPLGGWSLATLAWLPPARRTEPLTDEEEDALGRLGDQK